MYLLVAVQTSICCIHRSCWKVYHGQSVLATNNGGGRAHCTVLHNQHLDVQQYVIHFRGAFSRYQHLRKVFVFWIRSDVFSLSASLLRIHRETFRIHGKDSVTDFPSLGVSSFIGP